LTGRPSPRERSAHPPCLHSCMKCLRGLPCRFWASAFCEHSIDLAVRAPASSEPGATFGFAAGPPVESGAAASKAKAPPETKTESAAAQTRALIRMLKGYPVVVHRL